MVLTRRTAPIVCFQPSLPGEDAPEENAMAHRPSFSQFLTNLDQPMPLPEKLAKLTRNMWRRAVLRQNCCGHDGEPGC
jgi:hypothetical protein